MEFNLISLGFFKNEDVEGNDEILLVASVLFDDARLVADGHAAVPSALVDGKLPVTVFVREDESLAHDVGPRPVTFTVKLGQMNQSEEEFDVVLFVENKKKEKKKKAGHIKSSAPKQFGRPGEVIKKAQS